MRKKKKKITFTITLKIYRKRELGGPGWGGGWGGCEQS